MVDRVILVGWIGNRYLSQGPLVQRRQRGAFLGFLFFVSAANIVIGFFLSIWRCGVRAGIFVHKRLQGAQSG